MPETTSDLIRYYRVIVKGWSQQSLSDETARHEKRVPKYDIARIEKNERKPDFGEAWAICKALGVTFGHLGLTTEDYPELRWVKDRAAVRLLATARKLTRQTHRARSNHVQSPLVQAVR